MKRSQQRRRKSRSRVASPDSKHCLSYDSISRVSSVEEGQRRKARLAAPAGCHRSLMSPPEAWPECRVTTVASSERLGVCNLLWPPEAASVECVTYCGLQRLGVCNVLWPSVAWSVSVTYCSFQRAPGVCNLLWPPAQRACSV